ncbi:iron chelate uptake ABC transporter family permease subunit [Paenibacillus cremeus]|uniref:Iron chelate uptake ABC transporter family permease subunit n=1 Tax=Paenibacillus cremeus TaxID=2163881 RepID=A0A559JKA7_9BACL|nr:iron chelate uptake ABC transporter family permease subunit [Paenibacillus cremeus]
MCCCCRSPQAGHLELGRRFGRIILIPREIPAGILCAVIGAPYFLMLLRKQTGKSA